MPTYNVNLESGATPDGRAVKVQAGSMSAGADWVLFFYGTGAGQPHDVAAAFPTHRVLSVVAEKPA